MLLSPVRFVIFLPLLRRTSSKLLSSKSLDQRPSWFRDTATPELSSEELRRLSTGAVSGQDLPWTGVLRTTSTAKV
jgi:hypothetical protein